MVLKMKKNKQKSNEKRQPEQVCRHR